MFRTRCRAAVVALAALALTFAGLTPSAASATSGCTITGTDGADVLVGTDGADVICGLGGDDAILGGAGDDRLDGGRGADTIDGGEGADVLVGGDGRDELAGGAGNDALDGGNDHDLLDGGTGDDTLAGGNYRDTLLGGGGNDTLQGGNDVDRLVGGEGDDLLDGGNADDVLSGDDGDDILVGFNGHDLASGGPGADQLRGDNGDDRLFGGSGADTLVGFNGADMLSGGPGDDGFDGGNGRDVCVGSTGINTFVGCEEASSSEGPDVEDEDADADGVPDDREILAGLDPLVADTDGDGLLDGSEILTVTDPTSPDGDGDGQADGAEDADGDGVTNAVEIADATLPFRADSDADRLGDGDEKARGTDPLLADTDGDGLGDGDEVDLGSDPLAADTDADGVGDALEEYSRELTLDGGASLSVAGPGGSVLGVRLAVAEEALFADVAGVLTTGIVVDAPQPVSGELSLPFDPSAVPAGDEVAALHFDAERGTFDLPAEQVVDRTTGVVTVTTDDFSPFVVVNLTQFRAIWEREMVTPREGSGGDPVDVALVLDSSGSMTSNDPTGARRTAAKLFVDALLPGDQAAVIRFASSALLLQGMTGDMAAVKGAIDRVNASGGTNIGLGVGMGLSELEFAGDPSHGRVMVLLTDGQGSYSASHTERAIRTGTVIYTVGLGSSVDAALLQDIAASTGGDFFPVDSAADLVETFERIGGDLGAPDTDGDGLADETESSGVRDGHGRTYVTDPADADTDGDGLLDGEEVGAYVEDAGPDGFGDFYWSFSDPTRADTDDDGLADPQELDLATHPWLRDSDSDGLRDLVEVDAGFDPLATNPDEDYKFDDEELRDGTDPFGYDLDGMDNAHAAFAGFIFGDAWDSAAAGWAQVNESVASSPWYLVGQLVSGVLLIGDLRDMVYGAAEGNWGNAGMAAFGIIPGWGDAGKVLATVVPFALKTPRAARAAVEVAERVLPQNVRDDVVRAVSQLASARLARDLAVHGLPAPRASFEIASGTWTNGVKRISGDPAQARALQDELDRLVALDRSGAHRVSDVRVNQRQVGLDGGQVGINRPDLQYTLDGQRHYLEWDRPLCSDPATSLRGATHGLRIGANDASVSLGTTLRLLMVGACE